MERYKVDVHRQNMSTNMTKKEYLDMRNWCIYHKIKNLKIDRNGFINVDGDVDLSGGVLDSIPYKFGKVSGNFNISRNSELSSLENCPDWVGGNFDCSECSLNNLNTSYPITVLGNFDCSNCGLTSLELNLLGMLKSFDCSENQLTSLEGGPKFVKEIYDCSHNKLRTLRGVGIVGKKFFCYANEEIKELYALKISANKNPDLYIQSDFFSGTYEKWDPEHPWELDDDREKYIKRYSPPVPEKYPSSIFYKKK